VHDGDGAVGATDLMRSDHEEVLLLDLTWDEAQVAAQVEEVLLDEERLLRMAKAASARARSWSEEENARELLVIIHSAYQARAQARDSQSNL
jgi:hypothetical protein